MTEQGQYLSFEKLYIECIALSEKNFEYKRDCKKKIDKAGEISLQGTTCKVRLIFSNIIK